MNIDLQAMLALLAGFLSGKMQMGMGEQQWGREQQMARQQYERQMAKMREQQERITGRQFGLQEMERLGRIPEETRKASETWAKGQVGWQTVPEEYTKYKGEPLPPIPIEVGGVETGETFPITTKMFRGKMTPEEEVIQAGKIAGAEAEAREPYRVKPKVKEEPTIRRKPTEIRSDAERKAKAYAYMDRYREYCGLQEKIFNPEIMWSDQDFIQWITKQSPPDPTVISRREKYEEILGYIEEGYIKSEKELVRKFGHHIKKFTPEEKAEIKNACNRAKIPWYSK